MSKGLLCLGLSCLVCTFAAGCFISSDTSGTKLPTVGEELRELKLAHDEGALQPEEYDVARRRILSRLDKPRG